MELSEASSSEEKRRSRKGGRAQGRSPAKKSKWAPKASSDEEDEEELEPVDSGKQSSSCYSTRIADFQAQAKAKRDGLREVAHCDELPPR